MTAARNTKPETRNPDKNETFSLNITRDIRYLGPWPILCACASKYYI